MTPNCRFIFYLLLFPYIVGAQICFKNQDLYPALKYPYDLTCADFTYDGKMDIVVVNDYSDSITFLRGDGQGNFTTSFLSIAPKAWYVEHGDFNADGNLDLVTANLYISIYFGDGDGNFSQSMHYPTPSYPGEIAVSDLNNDSKLDIVTVTIYPHYLCIFYGIGNGMFASPVYTPMPQEPYAVNCADYNNDGNMDIATGNQTGGSFCIMLGDGTGNFSSPFFLSSNGNQILKMESVDINADGYIDIIAAGDGNNFIVLLGQGNANFSNPMMFNVQGPVGITSGDFDMDGKIDIAVTRYFQADGVVVFKGTGTGSFVPTYTAIAGASTFNIITADFNGDNRPDMATTNLSGNVSIFLNEQLMVSSWPNITCSGQTATISANGPANYSWSVGHNSAEITVNPIWTTQYTVTGTTGNGCMMTKVFKQIVATCAYINENDIKVYPNPCKGNFLVSLDNPENVSEVKVYNTLGVLIYSGTITSETQVDLRDQPSGVYLLIMNSDTKKLNFKIIIE
jgi:hypothetical protein